MGRSATSKLAEANDLSREAGKLKRKDPESARLLEELAHSKRKSAIKQLKRRPKRRATQLGLKVQ